MKYCYSNVGAIYAKGLLYRKVVTYMYMYINKSFLSTEPCMCMEDFKELFSMMCCLSLQVIQNISQFSLTRVSRSNPFCIITLHDWLKKLVPLYHPTRSKTKLTSHTFLWALCQLHVHMYFTLSLDWFIEFSVSF